MFLPFGAPFQAALGAAALFAPSLRFWVPIIIVIIKYKIFIIAISLQYIVRRLYIQ